MPLYEFECRECGYVSEELCEFNKAKIKCQSCGSNKTYKIISTCSFAVKNTILVTKHKERHKKTTERQTDLRENYGVYSLRPLPTPDLPGRPNTEEQVYKEIKEAGTYAKDAMQASMEINAKKQDERMKMNKEKNRPNTQKRIEELKQKGRELKFKKKNGKK